MVGISPYQTFVGLLISILCESFTGYLFWYTKRNLLCLLTTYCIHFCYANSCVTDWRVLLYVFRIIVSFGDVQITMTDDSVLYWVSVNGQPCGFSAGLRKELHVSGMECKEDIGLLYLGWILKKRTKHLIQLQPLSYHFNIQYIKFMYMFPLAYPKGFKIGRTKRIHAGRRNQYRSYWT